MILSLADHSQFGDPCYGKSLWGKWDCICFSNQTQLGILPTVENTVRLSGLISFRINKYVLSEITAVFSNLWDHPNPTKHLDLGMELNNWIWFQPEVTDRHTRRTAENWYWTELSPSSCSGTKSSSSIYASPPEIIRGTASRFQSQQHPGTLSTWAIFFTLQKDRE